MISQLQPDPQQLLTWLSSKRWYAGRDRTARAVGVVSAAKLGHTASGGEVVAAVVRVESESGPPDEYFVPWLSVASSAGANFPADTVISSSTAHVFVDAMQRPGAVRVLLRALIDPPPGLHARWTGVEIAQDAAVELSTAEQSNTSVVVAQSYVAKAYRKVQPGANPEVEIGEALGPRSAPRTAALRGFLRLASGDAAYDVLVVHERVSGSDGFALAIDDCTRSAGAQTGLHFPGAAYELGIALGALHQDLADALGQQHQENYPAELAARLNRRLDALGDISELDPYRGRARAMYDALARLRRPSVLQRIHGDLHLGQLLFGDDGWVFLDFEGEPRRPLGERRAPDSPLRDVAGIVRSFGYAAGWAGRYQAAQRDWEQQNVDLFLEGYRLQCPDTDDADILHALVLDKALYEVGYEAAYRPERLTIPLRAVEQLVGSGPAT